MASALVQTYSPLERLAAAKLQEIVSAMNNHDHGAAGGASIDPVSAISAGGLPINKLVIGAAGQFLRTSAASAVAWETRYRSAYWFVSGDVEDSLDANVSGTIRLPFSGTILGAYAYVNTAPTGAGIIVDVLVDAVSIWNNVEGNQLSISAAGTNGSKTSFYGSRATVTKNSAMTIQIDQVGSTIAGADLTVLLEIQEI